MGQCGHDLPFDRQYLASGEQRYKGKEQNERFSHVRCPVLAITMPSMAIKKVARMLQTNPSIPFIKHDVYPNKLVRFH
jgi:hypothetical protein